MLAEIYLLRLEAMARASEEATNQPFSFRPAHRNSRADLPFDVPKAGLGTSAFQQRQSSSDLPTP